MGLSYNTVYKWRNLTEDDFNAIQSRHEFVLDNYRQYFIEQLKVTPQMNDTLLYKRLKDDFGDEIEVPISTLAVISFKSGKKLSVVPVSENMPSKGDRIVVISNPEGEKFISTFGRIKSSKPEKYKFNDDRSDNIVLKHSAYEAPGSSGSAVYDEKMELVGINIGGGGFLF